MLGILLLVLILGDPTWAGYYGNYDCNNGKDVFVHLFEWKWKDVAKECEGFLSSHGFCAVQVRKYSVIILEQIYFFSFYCCSIPITQFFH